MQENKEQTDVTNSDSGRNEVQSLRQKNEELVHEMKSINDAILRLQADMVMKEKEIAVLRESRDGAIKTTEELKKSLKGTVTAYRELVMGTNPEVVSELIKGDSVAEVNESLKKAQTLMEKVRQGMEVEAGRMRVPAGAPARTQPELSGLTAREKIRYGIGRAAQG